MILHHPGNATPFKASVEIFIPIPKVFTTFSKFIMFEQIISCHSFMIVSV